MSESSAEWHPDPFGRYELRYWDGSAWTEHVSTQGRQATDSLAAPPPVPVVLTAAVAGGWHPDPIGRHEFRYWDGIKWTEHVASKGRQSIDPFTKAPPAATSNRAATAISDASTVLRAQASAALRAQASSLLKGPTIPGLNPNRGAQKIQRQVQRLGLSEAPGPVVAGVFDEPVLVINQRGKLVELRAEFAIHDQHGRQLAAVRGKRMSSRMQVVDMNGNDIIELRREGSVMSSKVAIADANGVKIGRIVPSLSWKELDRDYKFETPDKQLIGSVFSEDVDRSRARHRHRNFNVQDANGMVVARISKTRAGLAKEMFTKGDNYVLEFPRAVADPLRSLSVAAVLVIDAAFHQQ